MREWQDPTWAREITCLWVVSILLHERNFLTLWRSLLILILLRNICVIYILRSIPYSLGEENNDWLLLCHMHAKRELTQPGKSFYQLTLGTLHKLLSFRVGKYYIWREFTKKIYHPSTPSQFYQPFHYQHGLSKSAHYCGWRWVIWNAPFLEFMQLCSVNTRANVSAVLYSSQLSSWQNSLVLR